LKELADTRRLSSTQIGHRLRRFYPRNGKSIACLAAGCVRKSNGAPAHDQYKVELIDLGANDRNRISI